MTPVFKLVLFVLIFACILWAAYYSFRYLDNKIKSSETGWRIVGYSLLLFMVNALLFVGGLFLLMRSYAFLAGGG